MTHNKLAAAASVISMDPKIRAWLKQNDPRALAQIEEALDDYFHVPARDPLDDCARCGDAWKSHARTVAMNGKTVAYICRVPRCPCGSYEAKRDGD